MNIKVAAFTVSETSGNTAYIFEVIPRSLFLVAVDLYGDFWTESRKSVKQSIVFKAKLENIKPVQNCTGFIFYIILLTVIVKLNYHINFMKFV